MGRTETVSITLDNDVSYIAAWIAAPATIGIAATACPRTNSIFNEMFTDMTVTPTVSVVMPAFNAAEFIDEAISSILEQTFRDFEFIIVDDGSTDNTADILQKYAGADGRVRVFRQANQGVIAALNCGCRMAQGQFIARMDADDVSLPQRFDRQLEFLKGHPEIGILGTWASQIDKQGSIIGTWCLPASPKVLKWTHFFRVGVIHPTVLMRREILEKVNFYRPEAMYADDWDLWLRASAITEFGNTPEILFKYRISGKNISKRLRQECLEAPIKLLVPFISNFLNESTSIEAVVGLRGNQLASLRQIQLTAALLEKMYHRFVSKYSLSSEELNEISRDAAKKLGCLALQASRFSGLEFLSLFKRALRLDYRLMFPSAILTGLQRRRSLKFAK